jgi:uncharacterized membrane protein HdeD (DUF308 family)
VNQLRKLFVSYARENKPDVDQLVEHLRTMGYDTWVDAALRGGQDWWDEILDRIANTDVVIAIYSAAALNSTACAREFEWATALGKPLVPVAVEPPPTALPSRFARRQIIDYSQPPQRDRAALQLQGALATLPPAPPLPELLPEPPKAPLSYLTDIIDLITQPSEIDHDRQHQILHQLEPALTALDPLERRGGRDILERFSARRELYADVDRAISRLRTLGDQPAEVASEIDTVAGQDSSEAKPSGEPTHVQPPKSPIATGETPTREPTARSVRSDAPSAPADHSRVVADQSGTIRDQRRATPKPPDLLDHLWISTLASGVLTVLVGIVLLLWPGLTWLIVGMLFGLYLLIASIAQAFFGFAMRRAAIGSALLFISGAACLMLAVSAFTLFQFPFIGGHFHSVAIDLAFGLMLGGGAQTVAAVIDHDLPARGAHIGVGVINLIASVVILAVPFDSSNVLVVVAGLSLVVIGGCEIVSSFGIRKAARPAGS